MKRDRARRLRHLRLVASASLAVLAVGRVAGEPIPVAIGTPVGLEFLQHVSSANDAVGTPVFAQVSHDVRRFGRTVVRAGELVEGTVAEASIGRVAGLPGAVVVVFRDVAAVDGTRLPLDARVVAQGADRSLAAGIISSLIIVPAASGASPLIARGTLVNAQVSATVAIDPDAATPPAPRSRVPAIETRVLPESLGNVSLAVSSKSAEVVRVRAPAPAGIDTSALQFALLEVNGQRLPRWVKPSETADGVYVFPAWQVARFCELGENRLLFGWVGPDSVVSAENEVGMRFGLRGRR
ncbi:MAG TPA: hypothetical protein VJ011_05950 [Steroidobacteraceae bacterium]|nr:hypothetical protein [Steroidobacteraceae bacterium]